MRLIIFFDLPVETALDRKNYRKFRKFLIENGYMMIQYSVYSKILLNPQSLNVHRIKLTKHIPRKGLVESLLITEKQFANIETLTGGEKHLEQIHSVDRVTEL